jgi:hypothetical protein
MNKKTIKKERKKKERKKENRSGRPSNDSAFGVDDRGFSLLVSVFVDGVSISDGDFSFRKSNLPLLSPLSERKKERKKERNMNKKKKEG